MAITAAYEKRDSPTLSAEVSKIGITREFYVYSNSANDGPLTIYGGVPGVVIGSSYAYGSEASTVLRVVHMSATRDEIVRDGSTTSYRWIVAADYETPDQNSNQPPQPDPNPLLRPVQISGGTVASEKTTQKDRDGAAIKNTAKDLYPPVHMVDSDFEVTLVRNESSSPASIAEQYTNTVNSAGIWGGATGTWLCTSITYSKQFENDYVFYQVTYVFRYREDKHVLKLVSNGFHELVGGNKVDILLSDKSKPSEPQPLDSNGAKVTDPANAATQDFYLYKEKNFSTLGLPSSI